jgi:sporulation integral membrane protein YtvI
MELDKRKRFIINISYWAIILAIVFLVFKYLLHLVMPFFLALIFASIMRPLAKFLNRTCHIRYNIAAIFSVILFFAILVGLVVLIVVNTATGVVDLVEKLPQLYTQSIEPGLQNMMQRLEEIANRFDPAVVELVESATPQIISTVGNAVTSFSMTLVSWLTGSVGKVPTLLLSTVICIIATIFMSIDYSRIARFIMGQVPERFTHLVLSIKDSLIRTIVRYGKSYLLILLITFAELSIGLLIIRVPSAILIGLLIAILDIFPVVGTGLVLLPWSVISLIQGNVVRSVSLLILYIVITVIRQIIEPKIVGRHVGLHPLVTLISMFVGASLFGGVGLFGLPILVAIVKNLDDEGVIRIFKHDPEKQAGTPPAQDGSAGPGKTVY